MTEADWGFPSMIKRGLFLSEEPGKRFLVDDAFTVSVFVQVIRDEYGTLWHNFLKCVRRAPVRSLCEPLSLTPLGGAGSAATTRSA
jgi:hypothetical protein